MRKVWTHTELTDLFNLRKQGKTLKEMAVIYGVSESAMQKRMDRNPLDPEFRLTRHKDICGPQTDNRGYCSRCTCLYKPEDLCNVHRG